MEIPGGGGSNVKPSEMENPRGWGVKLEKTLRGGVWIFSGTTQFWIMMDFTCNIDDSLRSKRYCAVREQRITGR